MTLIGNTHRPPRGSLQRTVRTSTGRISTGRTRIVTAAAVTAAAALAAGGLGTLSAGAATHPARAAHHTQAGPATTRTARMVKIRNRMGIGRMLVTARTGRALYILPGARCTAGCLTVWPRLVLPRGKTIPTGASCLGTLALQGVEDFFDRIGHAGLNLL